MGRKTVPQILQKKMSGVKISMLTCYDYSIARLLSDTNIDIILVGDSLGNVKLGLENTLPVTVDNMIYHTKAVKNGNDNALIVCDMPFMSYEISVEDAVRNAGRIIKESGANAVKLEGGIEMADRIEAIVKAKIPVMGHLGLTPQSVNQFGGFKVQAKEADAQNKLLEDISALEKAGAFSVVLEAVPQDFAKKVVEESKMLVIGIGAGKYCDGQVLVIDDMLGVFSDFTPKFVKKYADLSGIIKKAVSQYIEEVESGAFPSAENIYK
ncbi:MAG: 3-methyl-2-oxobutanoate hydroxymethyltransferase [Elusimicrobiota bacterium]|jgi:3-methyl-2-oxobutanoate hydroxymethyltransferase|nr:3-methyl-2-oxobutanoate hydroxymethyltransferase [Elusimicrobiota bacterium]